MIEALWSLEFESNLEKHGAGVVIFETGKIFGGDAGFYYLGSYSVENGFVNGDVVITRYQPGHLSVLGFGDKITIRLSGKLETPTMTLNGYRVDAPKTGLRVRCQKRADLP